MSLFIATDDFCCSMLLFKRVSHYTRRYVKSRQFFQWRLYEIFTIWNVLQFEELFPLIFFAKICYLAVKSVRPFYHMTILSSNAGCVRHIPTRGIQSLDCANDTMWRGLRAPLKHFFDLIWEGQPFCARGLNPLSPDKYSPETIWYAFIVRQNLFWNRPESCTDW